MWVDLVEDLTAGTAMNALPDNIQEIYFDVDTESKVLATRYRNKITSASSSLKVYYKGASKVRQKHLTLFTFIAKHELTFLCVTYSTTTGTINYTK